MSLGKREIKIKKKLRVRKRDLDRETERQRDRETERQRDRETERQRDRETERQRKGDAIKCFKIGRKSVLILH